MRTLCILTLAWLILVGAGFYFQWFQVSTTSSADSTRVNVTVNKEKIREDVNKVKDEAQELSRDMSRKIEHSPAASQQ